MKGRPRGTKQRKFYGEKNNQFAAMLRNARLEAGMSQTEVAMVLGVGQRWIANIERGEAELLVGRSLGELEKIASAFKLSFRVVYDKGYLNEHPDILYARQRYEQ